MRSSLAYEADLYPEIHSLPTRRSSDLDTVTVSGALTWTGGAMGGTGTTVVAASGALALSGGDRYLDRVLENDGTATGTAGRPYTTGGTLTNAATFTAASPSDLAAYAYA